MRVWVIITIAILSVACENEISNQANNLPFSCIIQDNNWQATAIKGTLETENQQKTITLSATQDKGDGLQDIFEIRIIGFRGLHTYTLEDTLCKFECSIIYKSDFYIETPTMKVKITDYDIATQVISGIFEGELILNSTSSTANRNPLKLSVIQGKFDNIRLNNLTE